MLIVTFFESRKGNTIARLGNKGKFVAPDKGWENTDDLPRVGETWGVEIKKETYNMLFVIPVLNPDGVHQMAKDSFPHILGGKQDGITKS